MHRVSDGDVFNSASLDREELDFEKRKWIIELQIRRASKKMLEAEERYKEAKLKMEVWEARIAEQKERDRK